MKTLEKLQKGIYIAFGFNYNGGEPNEVIINNITEVYKDSVLVHFIYNGYKSLSEIIKKKDILAIRDEKHGTEEIKGWTGKYIILNSKKLNKILNEKS